MFQTRIEAAAFDPEDLHGLRSRIDAETGGGYATFRRSLAPRYAVVMRDLALGYAVIAATLAAVGLIGFGAIPLGAVLIGFAVAYLQLFIHEAAHFGLARTRAANDRIANALICWQVGTSIASYRVTHWEHHRSLGTARDTEISYRQPLRPGFVAAMLSGVHALRVFMQRGHTQGAGEAKSRRPLVIGILAHLALVAALVAAGWWTSAVAWVGGVGIFFPAFATIRQLLEHRPIAGAEHDAVTRLFGDDVFSRCFGGAGFNRHLLHHLEPQISYTRLPDLDRYLAATSAREELDARRSTYWRTFTALARSDRNG